MRSSGRALGAWAVVALLFAALVGACNRPPSVKNDGGAGSLAACLDQPTELPRPPTGQLPCELIPPGLVLR